VTPAQIRRIAILGSTGSIGRQAIDVVRDHPGLQVVGLCAGSDAEGVARQASELKIGRYGVGTEYSLELARLPEADVVLNAIVGVAGLRASVATLEAGKVLALANKESLVAGGELCLAAARRGGGTVVPVDSEHAAIARCLGGEPAQRIVLTASGGPFLRREDLSRVTVRDALQHPTWSMGPKITVDSATMMNKGLEVIEAHHLFGLPYERIDVVVHPQSLVHGIVHLEDGSCLMHAAAPDMRIPIQSALSDDRLLPVVEAIDFAAVQSLDFEALDATRFPAPGLARAAGERGATFPAALNGANEEAAAAFLAGDLAFTEITKVVEDVVDGHEPDDAGNLEAVLRVDRWARAEARELIRTR
jgi:1-deoxy-D-xylulose-5-phosphate reductoisomerase